MWTAVQRIRQHSRDGWAARHQEQLLAGAIPFSVYLRPFASTGGVHILRRAARRRIRIDINGPTNAVFRQVHEWNELEAVLARSLHSSAPLVGLGRPGEQFGAARLLTDDRRWQDLVTGLVSTACVIFLLPADDPGTRWELEVVRNSGALWRKTVLVVPGSGDVDSWLRAASGPSYGSSYSPATLRPAFYGALLNPERSNQVLRRAALDSLSQLGARAAARQVSEDAMGALLMLDEDNKLIFYRAFQGYVTKFPLSIVDYAPAFRFDRFAARNAIDDAVAFAQRY